MSQFEVYTPGMDGHFSNLAVLTLPKVLAICIYELYIPLWKPDICGECLVTTDRFPWNRGIKNGDIMEEHNYSVCTVWAICVRMCSSQIHSHSCLKITDHVINTEAGQ